TAVLRRALCVARRWTGQSDRYGLRIARLAGALGRRLDLLRVLALGIAAAAQERLACSLALARHALHERLAALRTGDIRHFRRRFGLALHVLAGGIRRAGHEGAEAPGAQHERLAALGAMLTCGLRRRFLDLDALRLFELLLDALLERRGEGAQHHLPVFLGLGHLVELGLHVRREIGIHDV